MAGRGKTGSLTQEQLKTLVGVGKDAAQVLTAPPPTYPPLRTKPITLDTTPAENYQILWKEDYFNRIRDSPYFLQCSSKTKINKSTITYGQKTANDLQSNKIKPAPEFDWSRMPAELKISTGKRKKNVNAKEIKKLKVANIEDRLKKLEEKERDEDDKDVQNKSNSDSEQEMEEEDVADEDIDDENDYGNSYFDNGEAYNEEDDNLDDGPVY